jgi:hypothetical protein
MISQSKKKMNASEEQVLNCINQLNPSIVGPVTDEVIQQEVIKYYLSFFTDLPSNVIHDQAEAKHGIKLSMGNRINFDEGFKLWITFHAKRDKAILLHFEKIHATTYYDVRVDIRRFEKPCGISIYRIDDLVKNENDMTVYRSLSETWTELPGTWKEFSIDLFY